MEVKDSMELHNVRISPGGIPLPVPQYLIPSAQVMMDPSQDLIPFDLNIVNQNLQNTFSGQMSFKPNLELEKYCFGVGNS